jgi:alkyl hydroperoxide reductase subunit AhpC
MCVEQLVELRDKISEIQKLDGEVIAFSTRDNKHWVQSTKKINRINFTMIPTPNRSVTEKFGIKNGGEGVVIIDKKGRIRYKNANLSHASSSLIIRELHGI